MGHEKKDEGSDFSCLESGNKSDPAAAARILHMYDYTIQYTTTIILIKQLFRHNTVNNIQLFIGWITCARQIATIPFINKIIIKQEAIKILHYYSTLHYFYCNTVRYIIIYSVLL